MACFHPLEAWQPLEGGSVSFREIDGKHLWLPCGKCIGCRLVRTRSWAIRCMHEAKMHRESCFVTLTYDDDHYSPSLNYLDFQKFLKRLRKESQNKVRFFVCGEYGEESLRPHFHALLFGRALFDGPAVGKDIVRSDTLQRLWPFGFNSVGEVTYDSAAYVARYVCKKVTGDLAESHYIRVDARTGEYVRVVPEFAHMSLKPGIGYEWFQKFWKEVYLVRDGIVRPGGSVIPPPRYYDKLLEAVDSGWLLEQRKMDREERALEFSADSTHSRLMVREACARAKLKFLRRGL